MVALSPIRAALQRAATAAGERFIAATRVSLQPVQLQRCSQVIVVPLTAMFALAVLLPLRLRVQIPLALVCLAPVLVGMVSDGMCATASADCVPLETTECIRPMALVLLGSVVAPALCQFASERASRQAFAKVYAACRSGSKQ